MRRTVELALALLLIVFIDAREIGRSLPRSLFGDEWRYLYYADNLLHGFYSPKGRVFLWNGPGYPLLLMPFVKADWVDGARYLNAVWHAGAIAYAWLILRMRLRTNWALAATAPFVLYGPLREHLPLLYTEVLCVFLITAWLYHSLRAPTRPGHAIAAGVYLGVLCLTKVIFGAALMAFLVIVLVGWLRTHSRILKAYVTQAALAFAICLPYLGYTYHLTGRPFYWSTVSPNAFYWLSSPYPDEWGDWYHHGWVYQDPLLRAHHRAIHDRLSGLDVNPDLPVREQIFNMCTPEAGEVWFKQGLSNVREHPLKFARNWCSNIARLFLDVPVSVRGTPFFNDYSVWHLPMLAWTAFVAIVAARRRLRLPSTWLPPALLALVTMGGYSLGSAIARYLIPFVPMWWLGTCCLIRGAKRR